MEILAREDSGRVGRRRAEAVLGQTSRQQLRPRRRADFLQREKATHKANMD